MNLFSLGSPRSTGLSLGKMRSLPAARPAVMTPKVRFGRHRSKRLRSSHHTHNTPFPQSPVNLGLGIVYRGLVSSCFLCPFFSFSSLSPFTFSLLSSLPDLLSYLLQIHTSPSFSNQPNTQSISHSLLFPLRPFNIDPFHPSFNSCFRYLFSSSASFSIFGLIPIAQGAAGGSVKRCTLIRRFAVTRHTIHSISSTAIHLLNTVPRIPVVISLFHYYINTDTSLHSVDRHALLERFLFNTTYSPLALHPSHPGS